MHNHYTPKEKSLVEVEEIEMKELNCTYKPFQTPPIHPTTGANTSNQVVVTQHTLKLPQQDRCKTLHLNM